MCYYSQFYEDKNHLVPLFEKIGTRNHCCLEVGAWDGKKFSNTRHFLERGWRGCLIESDWDRYRTLVANNAELEAVCWHRTIGHDCTLDHILELSGFPVDLDLMSIDVDGQDYYLWRDMEKYRPRVMVIEFNPCAPSERWVPAQGGEGQAGQVMMTELAEHKGYEVIGVTQVNLICVDRGGGQ